MIIVRLKGGLGNQMFEYALGRVLSIKNETELLLDLSFLDLNIQGVTKRNFDLDIFNIQAKIADKSQTPFIFKLYKSKILLKFTQKLREILNIKGQEKGFAFDPRALSWQGDVFLDGHFQSPKYFEGFEDTIKADFNLKNTPNEKILTLAEEIKKTNSLCMHIRRGDYVGNALHEVVDNEYYKTGLKYLSENTKIEKIYVFSDDISWCEKNLKFEMPVMLVDESFSGVKGEGHMYLMSLCNNFIIANSSFSWWGAWLSSRENKIVVCPKNWFSDPSINSEDLIPESWIRI